MAIWTGTVQRIVRRWDARQIPLYIAAIVFGGVLGILSTHRDCYSRKIAMRRRISRYSQTTVTMMPKAPCQP